MMAEERAREGKYINGLYTQDGSGTGPRQTNGWIGNRLDRGTGAWQAERKSWKMLGGSDVFY